MSFVLGVNDVYVWFFIVDSNCGVVVLLGGVCVVFCVIFVGDFYLFVFMYRDNFLGVVV